MHDNFIPITMFIGLTIVVSLFFWFRYGARHDIQETIRAALDKGMELSPEVIDRLGHPQAPKNRDLRLALIWLALGIALVLCGFALGQPDALRGILAGAAFPFCLGVAYLIMWRFTERD